MSKIALMIFGPPGSGKGTQANLAADHLGLVHFDTGRYLREYLHDPANQGKATVRRERQLNDSGALNAPSFVVRIVIKGVTKIAKAGYGVVFSGSPRTLYEAEKLLPVLERLYGKPSLRFVELQVHPGTSLKRNSVRIVCCYCDLTILRTLLPQPDHLKFCPFCGSGFKKRKDDNPKVIKIRLKQYEERTKPIFGYLKKRGYKLNKVNGEPLPFEVSKKIFGAIGFASNKDKKKK